MASLTLDETRKKVHLIIGQIQKGSFEDAEEGLSDVLVNIQKEYQNLESSVPKNHDIALLIQEMRNGFASMDKRFEVVDKRFEAMDKRFDDLIHQMDKRFEQIDKRFSFMQWTFSIFLSLIGITQALLLGMIGSKILIK